MKDKSKDLMGMNVYITNTPLEEVPTNYMHSLIHFVGRLRFCLKRGSHFLKLMNVKILKENV
jgi:hypothetical protein